MKLGSFMIKSCCDIGYGTSNKIFHFSLFKNSYSIQNDHLFELDCKYFIYCIYNNIMISSTNVFHNEKNFLIYFILFTPY